MDDISIKILDALFDLCEGENFVILDREDLTSRISYHDFAADELTEILEALAVDGFIDLKYADNTEFCVAMKTKGRTLIKQSRDRLQKLIDENPEVVQYREEVRAAEEDRKERQALEEEREKLLRRQEDKLAEARANLEGAISPADKAIGREELRRVRQDIRKERERVAELDDKIREADERESSRRTGLPNLAKGYAVHPSGPDAGAKEERKDRKTMLYAGIGAAIGAFVINLIFLIIYLVLFAK